jgi:hypothetical protein
VAAALDVALSWNSVVGRGGVVVGVLPVPDLPSGVAGVGEDRGDSRHHPALAAAMLVPTRVSTGWAGDVAVVEFTGDPSDAAPGKPLREDPSNMRCGLRIGLQTVQAPAP